MTGARRVELRYNVAGMAVNRRWRSALDGIATGGDTESCGAGLVPGERIGTIIWASFGEGFNEVCFVVNEVEASWNSVPLGGLTRLQSSPRPGQ